MPKAIAFGCMTKAFPESRTLFSESTRQSFLFMDAFGMATIASTSNGPKHALNSGEGKLKETKSETKNTNHS